MKKITTKFNQILLVATLPFLMVGSAIMATSSIRNQNNSNTIEPNTSTTAQTAPTISVDTITATSNSLSYTILISSYGETADATGSYVPITDGAKVSQMSSDGANTITDDVTTILGADGINNITVVESYDSVNDTIDITIDNLFPNQQYYWITSVSFASSLDSGDVTTATTPLTNATTNKIPSDPTVVINSATSTAASSSTATDGSVDLDLDYTLGVDGQNNAWSIPTNYSDIAIYNGVPSTDNEIPSTNYTLEYTSSLPSNKTLTIGGLKNGTYNGYYLQTTFSGFDVAGVATTVDVVTQIPDFSIGANPGIVAILPDAVTYPAFQPTSDTVFFELTLDLGIDYLGEPWTLDTTTTAFTISDGTNTVDNANVKLEETIDITNNIYIISVTNLNPDTTYSDYTLTTNWISSDSTKTFEASTLLPEVTTATDVIVPTAPTVAAPSEATTITSTSLVYDLTIDLGSDTNGNPYTPSSYSVKDGLTTTIPASQLSYSYDDVNEVYQLTITGLTPNTNYNNLKLVISYEGADLSDTQETTTDLPSATTYNTPAEPSITQITQEADSLTPNQVKFTVDVNPGYDDTNQPYVAESYELQNSDSSTIGDITSTAVVDTTNVNQYHLTINGLTPETTYDKLQLSVVFSDSTLTETTIVKDIPSFTTPAEPTSTDPVLEATWNSSNSTATNVEFTIAINSIGNDTTETAWVAPTDPTAFNLNDGTNDIDTTAYIVTPVYDEVDPTMIIAYTLNLNTTDTGANLAAGQTYQDWVFSIKFIGTGIETTTVDTTLPDFVAAPSGINPSITSVTADPDSTFVTLTPVIEFGNTDANESYIIDTYHVTDSTGVVNTVVEDNITVNDNGTITISNLNPATDYTNYYLVGVFTLESDDSVSISSTPTLIPDFTTTLMPTVGVSVAWVSGTIVLAVLIILLLLYIFVI